MGYALGGHLMKAESTTEKLQRLHESSLNRIEFQPPTGDDPLETLDVLHRCKGNLVHSAAHLGCSVRELLSRIAFQ